VGATREIAPKEIAAILAAMGDTPNRARLGLLYVTGCRPIELTWLGAESLRLDEPTPYICITGAKGGKNRMVPLPAFGLPYAEDFLRHQAWRPSRSLGAEMRSVAKRLGLQVRVPGKRVARITPYALRHTYAMQLRRAGAGLDDIADALGHHSLETTRRYAQAIPERQAKVTGAMWAAVGTA
jgi:integrase